MRKKAFCAARVLRACSVVAALLLATTLVSSSTGCFLVDKNMVRVSGSTTLLPTAQEAADLFMERTPGQKMLVQGGGSSVGVTQLKQGLVNIACTSRELKPGEDDGTFVDYKVALDVIAIVVNPDNGVENLSSEQVKEIFTGEITRWSEVGGADAAIVVVVRDQASGTRQMFDEEALGKGVTCINSAIECNSNGIVRETVAATDNAIGYVSLGFVNDNVKAVDYDGVSPEKETAKNGTYPLSRYLHMFTRGEPQGRVKDYLDLVMGEEFQLNVVAREYIPVVGE